MLLGNTRLGAMGSDLSTACFEEPVDAVDDRTAALVADAPTLVSGETADIVLDGVEGSNAAQHVGGHGRSLGQLVELTTHVRPAKRKPSLLMTRASAA